MNLKYLLALAALGMMLAGCQRDQCPRFQEVSELIFRTRDGVSKRCVLSPPVVLRYSDRGNDWVRMYSTLDLDESVSIYRSSIPGYGVDYQNCAQVLPIESAK